MKELHKDDYWASYLQILYCVCVREFFSFFFIVFMDILSEINFTMTTSL